MIFKTIISSSPNFLSQSFNPCRYPRLNTLLLLYYSLFTTHYSLLTFHYSLFTFHYSLFTIHYSLFTIHYSLFTTHYSLFTIHCSLFSNYGDKFSHNFLYSSSPKKAVHWARSKFCVRREQAADSRSACVMI